MATKILFRRDTAANWELTNPVLSQGELGLDLTNFIFKIGDGITEWNDLENAVYTNKADIDSPEFTGIPTAPTASASTNTTQIATTEFVLSEIEAAGLALGTNYSVADITERDNLPNLVIGDIVFVADDGDTKWAQYKVTDISPVVFLKIMDQDIFLNALSALDIKAAYESNADTNAFTDNLKTKLETTDIFDSDGTYANLRAQATTAEDVGLGNVTNESKTTMFTDAALTGVPTAPTAATLTNTTQIATTAFVQNEIAVIDGGEFN